MKNVLVKFLMSTFVFLIEKLMQSYNRLTTLNHVDCTRRNPSCDLLVRLDSHLLMDSKPTAVFGWKFPPDSHEQLSFRREYLLPLSLSLKHTQNHQ